MFRPLVLAVGLLTVLLVACNPGAYPVDIFPEMHYAQSQRRLEPNRLAAPPDAVPVTGRSAALTFDQVTNLQNPVQQNADTLEHARQVFQVNCAMCHGQDGHGQSTVAEYFRQAGWVPPVDLAGPRVRGRSDGQLYWLVTNGIGNMPPFGSLLSENDRWALLYVIHEVQGR